MHQRHAIFIMLAVCLCGLSSIALTDYYFSKFNGFQAVVAQKTQTRRPYDLRQVLQPEARLQCETMWRPFLKKSHIRIEYFTGYNNNYHYQVRDGFERSALLALLLSPCRSEHNQFCGFKPIHAELFTKSVLLPDGRQRTIEFGLHQASISANDKANRTNPQQQVHSEKVRQQFIQASGSADVLIYSGHSRYGGGPDFSPEVLTDTGDDFPSYYRQRKNGLHDLLGGLNSRTDEGLSLLLLGSCDSQKHFHQTFQARTDKLKTSLLGTSAVMEDTFFQTFFNLMQMLMTENCSEDYSQAFKEFRLNSYQTNSTLHLRQRRKIQ
jgi:hypothetical protein